ncbi:MAG: hypothetical protein K2H93_05575 [Oscillospiraceae bacterium]|nr:hypothetical protein [Oscillospiraceae bacterium]
MLRITDFIFDGNILSMTVWVEGKEEHHMSVDMDTFSVVESDIPNRIYERQAMVALERYKGKELPEKITSYWY